MVTQTTIQAAGRVLSAKNEGRLKALFSEIAAILMDAKVVSTEDLQRMLDKEIEEEEGDRAVEAGGAEVQAGNFGDELKQATWRNSAQQSIDMFRSKFMGLHSMPDAHVERQYGTDKDRSAIATEMLDDFHDHLGQHIGDFPGVPDSTVHSVMDPMPYYASAAETEEVSASTEADEEVVPVEEEKELEVTFNCEVSELAAAARDPTISPKSLANCLPIEGVLFYVDDFSESAPSKGSELPLYVPRHVAIAAADAINRVGGLPFDSDDSLSCHANNQIVGVMTGAEVRDNEFWVKGHLFPWSQGEKVSLISANQQVLGMSMNAHARTHPEVIKGVSVSYIDSLDILGANILYAKRATYQRSKARVVAAEIAASAPIITPPKTMEPEDFQKCFQSINTTLAALAEDSKKANEAINIRLDQYEASVNEIQAERKAAQQSIQAAQSEEQRKQEREDLVQAVSAAIASDREKLKEEILASINPRRQPPRITNQLVDVVASNATQQQGNAAQSQLREAQIKLNALRENGVMGPARAKLVEEINHLKAQLGAY